MIYLYTFAFILLSLQDFYSYELMLPIISLFGSLLLIGICLSLALQSTLKLSNVFSIPSNMWKLIFAIYIVPLFCGLIVSNTITLDFSNSRLFSFFLIPLLIVSLNTLYRNNQKKFIQAFRCLLYFHLLFFFFNLFDIYFLGHIFDPMTFFADEQSVHFSYINGFALRRACGLFQEPGTFSTYYALLLSGYINLTSRIKDYNNLPIVTLSILALISSLSIYGIIFSAVIYFWQNLYFRSSILLKLLQFLAILASMLLIFVRFFSLSFIQSSKESSGLSHRFSSFNWISDNFFIHPLHTLFGFDILNPQVGYVDIGTPVNDSSMIVYFLLFTGVVGTTIFLLSLLPFLKDKLPAILMLLLSKLTLFAPITSMIIFTIFINPISTRKFK